MRQGLRTTLEEAAEQHETFTGVSFRFADLRCERPHNDNVSCGIFTIAAGRQILKHLRHESSRIVDDCDAKDSHTGPLDLDAGQRDQNDGDAKDTLTGYVDVDAERGDLINELEAWVTGTHEFFR